MSEVTIAVPFQIDAFGRVATTSDQKKIWNDRVTMALGTLLTERVMRPEFGASLGDALFESSEFAAVKLEAEIYRVFQEHLPLLSVVNIGTTTDQATGTVTVDVVYALPNADEATTSVGIAVVASDAPLYEESL